MKIYIFIIIICCYALFGSAWSATVILLFSLNDISGVISAYGLGFICKIYIILITIIICLSRIIKNIGKDAVKNAFSVVSLIILFFCLPFLIMDINYVLYEMKLFSLNNHNFYALIVIPCIIRVFCFFFSMVNLWMDLRRSAGLASLTRRYKSGRAERR